MNNRTVDASNLESLVTLLARGVTALETIALGLKVTGSARQRKRGVNSIRLAEQRKANTDEEVARVIRKYILDYQDNLPHTEYVEPENPKIVGATDAASCAGRFQRDNDGRPCLAVTRYWFVPYAAKCGIDKGCLKRWLKQNGITVSSVRLTPRGSTFWCYVIPEMTFKESANHSVM